MYESSYHIEDNENISICYSNIYCVDGRLKYLTIKDESPPQVSIWTNSIYWNPDVVKFNNEQELIKYVNNLNLNHSLQINLAVFCDMIWAHNIGHALFDGLYPIYLALVKFNYILDNFSIIINKWEDKTIMVYEILKKFSGSDIIECTKVKESFCIKKLVSGTTNTGNIIVNKNYKLYGTKYDGIRHFRERMLSRYKIQTDLPVNNKLNIVIIDNKRYSEYDKSILEKIIAHYSNSFNIKYVNWRTYSSFQEQLNEISNVDIQITGPGTGMLYIPFLKNNSVNINLGYMEHIPNYSRGNIIIKDSDKLFTIPGWMEQSICSGCEHVNTIYYDRINYNNIEFLPMINIVDRAISIINQNIKVETNLNTDALIFVEYCNQVDNSKEICDNLMSRSLYADVNLFVNEHPYAAPKDIVDIELLRKIKKEFNYTTKYEIK